jgi:hypothetical protein
VLSESAIPIDQCSSADRFAERGNFALPPNHPDLSFGINREWYSAKQIGGEQSEAVIGIISKKRKAPHDDAEEAHTRRSRQPTAQSISDDESSD